MKSLIKQLIYFDFRNSYWDCMRYLPSTSKGTCKMNDNDIREAFIILSDDTFITVKVASSIMRARIKCNDEEGALCVFNQLSNGSFYLCYRESKYMWI